MADILIFIGGAGFGWLVLAALAVDLAYAQERDPE